jgi:hypothetical protein
MKKIFVIIIVLGILPTLLASGGKVVYIPDNVKIEENASKEIIVRNLSEVEIYAPYSIDIVNDYIYMLDKNSSEVIKLSLKGKIIGRVGREGQGPGEFIGIIGLSPFKENIAILDAYKAVICTKNLEILKEYKLGARFNDIILNKNNRVYLYNIAAIDRYYFSVYTEDFKFLRKFAKKITSPKKNRNRLLFDSVANTLYIPEENGIWVSFKNRYDLIYYKDEKLIVEIRAKKFFFSGEEQERMGRKFLYYKDRSVLLAKLKDELLYFYKKDNQFFCDVFNLSNNYQFRRRIKFPVTWYPRLVHHKGYTFYGLRFDKERENFLLAKIEIKQSK